MRRSVLFDVKTEASANDKRRNSLSRCKSASSAPKFAPTRSSTVLRGQTSIPPGAKSRPTNPTVAPAAASVRCRSSVCAASASPSAIWDMNGHRIRSNYEDLLEVPPSSSLHAHAKADELPNTGSHRASSIIRPARRSSTQNIRPKSRNATATQAARAAESNRADCTTNDSAITVAAAGTANTGTVCDTASSLSPSNSSSSKAPLHANLLAVQHPCYMDHTTSVTRATHGVAEARTLLDAIAAATMASSGLLTPPKKNIRVPHSSTSYMHNSSDKNINYTNNSSIANSNNNSPHRTQQGLHAPAARPHPSSLPTQEQVVSGVRARDNRSEGYCSVCTQLYDSQNSSNSSNVRTAGSMERIASQMSAIPAINTVSAATATASGSSASHSGAKHDAHVTRYHESMLDEMSQPRPCPVTAYPYPNTASGRSVTDGSEMGVSASGTPSHISAASHELAEDVVKRDEGLSLPSSASLQLSAVGGCSCSSPLPSQSTMLSTTGVIAQAAVTADGRGWKLMKLPASSNEGGRWGTHLLHQIRTLMNLSGTMA